MILYPENISEIVFSHPSSRQQLERICTKNCQVKTIVEYLDNPEYYSTFYQAARLVC